MSVNSFYSLSSGTFSEFGPWTLETWRSLMGRSLRFAVRGPELEPRIIKDARIVKAYIHHPLQCVSLTISYHTTDRTKLRTEDIFVTQIHHLSVEPLLTPNSSEVRKVPCYEYMVLNTQATGVPYCEGVTHAERLAGGLTELGSQGWLLTTIIGGTLMVVR